jgi:DNA-binding XRE family transcriptional regulator
MSFLDYAKMDIIPEIDDSETRPHGESETRSQTEIELWGRITSLLAARTHRRVVAALPPELSRAELRATVALAQHELAQRLGLTQARVSRIERHPNPHVSLLSTYIHGLGGRLHLLARFDKGDFRILL